MLFINFPSSLSHNHFSFSHSKAKTERAWKFQDHWFLAINLESLLLINKIQISKIFLHETGWFSMVNDFSPLTQFLSPPIMPSFHPFIHFFLISFFHSYFPQFINCNSSSSYHVPAPPVCLAANLSLSLLWSHVPPKMCSCLIFPPKIDTINRVEILIHCGLYAMKYNYIHINNHS